MKRGNVQFELSMRFSVALILVIIIVSSSVMALVTMQYNRIVTDDIEKEIQNKIVSVDRYFDDVKTPLVMLSRAAFTQKAMKDFEHLDNRKKLEVKEALDGLMQNIATFKPYISDLIIVGKKGFLFNLYNDNQDKYLKSYDFEKQSWFAEIADGGKKLYYMGEHEADYYIAQGKKVYSVVLPVYMLKNKIGYVICDIEAEAIDEIITKGLAEDCARLNIYDADRKLICERGNMDIEIGNNVFEQENRKNNGILNFLHTLFSEGNLIARVTSEVTGWTYVYLEPYANFSGFVRNIFMLDIIFIIIGVLVIRYFSREMNRQVLAPMKNIRYQLQNMSINQTADEIRIQHRETKNLQELSIEIEMILQDMDRLINENYLYEIQNRDAQIQILVNQLSPHFLYNTLQLIEYQSFIQKQDNVSKIIASLSYILRYAISTKKIVTLSEELKYVEAYLDIYRLRYENKMGYKIRRDASVDEDQMVPKMILEPIVENCLKHGFRGKMQGAYIGIYVQERNGLQIIICDNGRGISEEKLSDLREKMKYVSISSGHIGLNNVNSIIKLQYGNEYGVEIESSEGNGTRVMLRLPQTT